MINVTDAVNSVSLIVRASFEKQIQLNISTMVLTKWRLEPVHRVSDIQTPLLFRRPRRRSSKTAGISATPFLQSTNYAMHAIRPCVPKSPIRIRITAATETLINSLLWQTYDRRITQLCGTISKHIFVSSTTALCWQKYVLRFYENINLKSQNKRTSNYAD